MQGENEVAAVCAALALADGPAPIGEAACLVILAGLGIAALLSAINAAQAAGQLTFGSGASGASGQPPQPGDLYQLAELADYLNNIQDVQDAARDLADICNSGLCPSNLSIRQILASQESQSQANIDVRADAEVDNATDEGNMVYFVHGTTTTLWGSGYDTPSSGGAGFGDYGVGLYTFADNSWGRSSASSWAKGKSPNNAILLRYKIPLETFLGLNALHVSPATLNAVYSQLNPDKYSGYDVVIGPVAARANDGSWVPRMYLPPQFKFEQAIPLLMFDSVVPAT